jgi:hypothetical protein
VTKISRTVVMGDVVMTKGEKIVREGVEVHQVPQLSRNEVQRTLALRPMVCQLHRSETRDLVPSVLCTVEIGGRVWQSEDKWQLEPRLSSGA